MRQARSNLDRHLPPDFDRVWSSPQPSPPNELLFAHLTLNGDGSTIDMAVDGTTPKKFRYVCPADKVALITRVLMHLHDIDIQYEYFAGLGVALTNGLTIKIHDADDTVLKDFTNDHPFKHTAQFSMLAGPDIPILSSAVGNDPDVLAMRWTLAKSGFSPLLTAGQYFEVVVQDDLQGLSHFEWIIHGRVCEAP